MITIIDKILTWIGQVLRTFDAWTGSYMVAMLIFAVIIEILLLPFGIKQQKNQIKQAKLRPKEMAIRNKYKGRNDQATMQKMQQEINDFYQKENFNPMSGCLPLLIQLPIIIALYQIIINPMKYVVGFSGDQVTAIMNRINELLPEAKVTASQTIPFIDHIKNLGVEAFSAIEGFADKVPTVDSLPNFNVFGSFNLALTPSKEGFSWLLIIPVLVFVSQFFTTKLTRKFSYQAPSAQDANQGCSTTVMDITFPLTSVYFAYILPGAVGVYWIAKSILSLIKQIILTKLMPFPEYSEADYKAAEKEMNAKAPKNVSKTAGSGKPVRSLHHIDDEDYEDTREAALERKRAIEEAEEAERAAREAAKGKKGILSAPLKEDKRDEGPDENQKEEK